MALFKPFMGSRTSLDTQPLHDGYAYFCTDDGSFHIDYVDSDGNLQRKQINAKDAETLCGMSLEQIQEAIDSNQPVIDVSALPTENINDNAFYRTSSGMLVRDQLVYSGYTCHCVESLPEVGLPATNVDPDLYPDQPFVDLYRTAGDLYYTVADAALYGYVDDVISTRLGISVGWHPVSDIVGAVDYEYAGVITALVDCPTNGVFCLLLDYTIYSYKDGWASHKVIGRAGVGSFAEAFNHPSNTATGDNSHAEGYYTCASEHAAHAEGMYTYASESAAHAEGVSTYAARYADHAEGYFTYAKGGPSHAEGIGLCAYSRLTGAANSTTYITDDIKRMIVGACVKYEVYVDDVLTYRVADIISVDTENSTITLNKTLSEDTDFDDESVEVFVAGMALGSYSHSEGNRTIAACQSQHTEGEFNLVDPEFDVNNDKRGRYVHIVGNGTSHTKRSNAHTLDWSGNAWFAGDVYVGGASQDDGAKTLATTEYVDSKAAQPDWSVNDETSSGYIKNRTHWIEENIVEAVPETTLESNGYIYGSILSISSGTRCIVTWEGEEYVCTARRDPNGMYKALVGDMTGDEPFELSIYMSGYVGPPGLCAKAKSSDDVVEGKVISIKIDKSVVHKLDTKYLPDNLAYMPKKSSVFLSSADWTGEGNLWSQPVIITAATATSKIDLLPTASQIVSLQSEEISLMIENDNGELTAYAIGGRPSTFYTMDVLLTEVVLV